MTLFGPVQVYMAPMMTVSGLICGRSYLCARQVAHGMVFSRGF